MPAGSESRVGHTLTRHLNDSHRSCVGTVAQRALFKRVDTHGKAQRMDGRVDGTIADSLEPVAPASNADVELYALAIARFEQMMIVIGDVAAAELQVGGLEQRPQLVGGHFSLR